MTDPITGTWDFFQDASEGLQGADMPHLLICGQDGDRGVFRSSNIKSREAVEWFRVLANELLDEIAAHLPE